MPKRVRFAARTEIYQVPSILEDATPSELESMWYTDNDFAQVQRDIKRSIRAMRRNDEESKKYCSRGLEHLRSAVHLEQRKINKDCVTEAVLGEQSRQRQFGTSRLCPELIAQAAMRHSEWARQNALALGQHDQQCVRGSVVASTLVRVSGGAAGRKVDVPKMNVPKVSAAKPFVVAPQKPTRLQQEKSSQQSGVVSSDTSPMRSFPGLFAGSG